MDAGSPDTFVEFAKSNPMFVENKIIAFLSSERTSLWSNNLSQFFGNISIERYYGVISILNIYLSSLTIFFIFILAKSFRFYFGKACMITAKNKINRIEKARFLIYGIRSYNKFLTSNLGIQLDESKIYSRVLPLQNINYDSITSSFDDIDKLKPLTYFTEFTCDNELVVQVTKIQQIKESTEFVVAILPITFTILGAALPNYFSALSGG